MSITSLSDWSKVELAAQTHELSNVETPKVPDPDLKSQLAMCTTHNGQLQARIKAINTRSFSRER